MQCYSGENFLYQFIYSYYPFGNTNVGLVSSGQIIVAIIVKSIIKEQQSLNCLLNHPCKVIIHLITTQFSYRYGGNDYFYAAFGNFFLKILSSKLNSLTSWSFQSLTQMIQNELQNNPIALQSIQTIKTPFKERLQQIAYIYQHTNSLPSLNQNQIQLKKLHFLQSFINFQNLQQPISKHKTKKNYKKSISQIPKSIINYKTNYQSNQEIMNPPVNIIKTQVKHEFILAFDDLLPQQQWKKQK